MWMMGYTDAGDFNDPFSARKLRPLMPRPAPASAAGPPPCLARFHGTDLFALNHHLAMAEQNKRDLNTQQVVVSSRWNPTTEQLQTLEELYRRGTRTPSAEQIQHITAQLRRYGKIEGKNVFYWFQNHKARERQKRRRQLESFPDDNGDKREASGAGTNRTLYEVEQTKTWASPTNSSTAAEKNGEAEAECKADDGWVQLEDDAELQRRRNATWQTMNLSCSSSSTNLINSSSAPTVTVPAPPSTLATVHFEPQDFINIFLEPYAALSPHRAADAQTLQLFPLESGGDRRHEEECSDNDEEEELEEESRVSSFDNIATPCQFIEFLPLKN